MGDWTESVLVQREIARYWRQPRVAGEYLGGMLKSMVARQDIERADAELWGGRILKYEADRVGNATPIWVSPDMLTVTEAAAESLPEWPLEPPDVPEPQGFVLFPRSYLFTDRMGTKLGLRAIAWSPLTGKPVPTDQDPPMEDVEGLFITLYSDRDESEDESLSIADRRTMPRWCMVHFAVWFFGRTPLSYDKVEALGDGYDGPDLDRRIAALIQSLFALMKQEIAITTYGDHYPRNIRRWWDRERLVIPTTRIITLRKRKHVDRDQEDGEGAAVEWSHRWIVSGHWHRYNTKEGPVLKWLLPYEKGPEDKPLIVKKNILRLTR